MALLPAYRYTSLESHHDGLNEAITPSTNFRLLVLDGGAATDEISCSLEQHCLATAPDYEAISYVWGDPTEERDIICSGQQLAITKSLHSALRRFRFTSQKRTLWADAICINQGDLGERSAQVSIMGKIYSQARQVLIWLGEETGNDSEAFDAMSQLQTILPKIPPTRNIPDLHALNTPEFFSRIMNSIPRNSLMQIVNLLSRPWFQRVWVIQEVLMAQSAQLFNGPKSIAWSTFSEVIEKITLYNIRGVFETFKLAVLALKNVALMSPENTGLRTPFFRLLCHARDFQSTDPRDKLYAPLGASDTKDVPWRSPDYTTEVSTLFVQYTKQELTSGSLTHLSATDYIDDTAQIALPTWVPDWSRRVDQVPFEALMGSFHAGGTSVPRLSFSSTEDLLIIKGKKISYVNRLGTIRYNDFATLYSTFSNLLEGITPTAADGARLNLVLKKWLLNWLTDCHKTAFGDGFSPTQEIFSSESYRKFCKALCFTAGMNKETPLVKRIVDRLSRLYLVLTRSLELQSKGMDLAEEDETEFQNTAFDMNRYMLMFGMRKYFCSDDSGRLAWVPSRAQVGDVFCVFLGAKVPSLLRQVADGRYELIGACYLQDCMNGEIVVANHFAIEEFVLV